MKNVIEYMNDLCRFYKKWWKFILKVMAIYAAFCAAVMAYGHWYHEIHECFQRMKMKILSKKEELTSGGLDCEAPEKEEDNDSVVASF